MNYDNTRFYPMLVRFGGVIRLIKGKDFLSAGVLSVLLCAISGHFALSNTLISNTSLIFATIGAALVAVIITGLAIIVSTSDDNFVILMKEAGIYENILFPFWLSSVVAGISIVSNIVSYVITLVKMEFIITINEQNYLINNAIFTVLLFFSLFFTFYALFMVITLIENALKYGVYRGASKIKRPS
jgi:hypothetical protein